MAAFLTPFFLFGAQYGHLVMIGIAMIYWLRLPLVFKKEVVIFGVVVGAVTLGLAVLLGTLFYHPRPFVVDGFEPMIPHAATNGFPSHHALISAAIAAIMTAFSLPLGAVLWPMAIWVGYSRVFVGVHHSLDIVGSFLIVTLVAGVIYWIFQRLRIITR